MLPKESTEDVIRRLRYIKGQLGGIEKMLDEGKEPDQIINQFKAAEEALHKAHFLLLDEVFRKGLALQLSEAIQACPGNCGEAAKIAFLKEKFPHLALSEITGKIKEVEGIHERMLNKHVKDKK